MNDKKEEINGLLFYIMIPTMLCIGFLSGFITAYRDGNDVLDRFGIDATDWPINADEEVIQYNIKYCMNEQSLTILDASQQMIEANPHE